MPMLFVQRGVAEEFVVHSTKIKIEDFVKVACIAVCICEVLPTPYVLLINLNIFAALPCKWEALVYDTVCNKYTKKLGIFS